MVEEKDMKKLAYEIQDYLKEKDYYHDVIIYFNNLAISSLWEGEQERNVSEYMEYFNTDTITMSFEGILYEMLNYNVQGYKEFNEFIKSKGFYFEFGNAWNLALYK